MKLLLNVFLISLLLYVQESKSQTIDTLVNVGNHSLHFRITKGQGMPILFESGAGDDGSRWDTLIKPISEIIGATLITYDRAGCGKSTIDTLPADSMKHGILDEFADLENALKKLGYDKQIMLVSHSYGGYYSTLYSVKHPDLVKSIVLIDVNLNFYDKLTKKDTIEGEEAAKESKASHDWWQYYTAVNFPKTSKLMSTMTIPQSIPVVLFTSGVPPQDDTADMERWRECHKKFVANRHKSIEITAHGCGHYIWGDNPGLIICTVARSYAETCDDDKKSKIDKRALDYAINASSTMVEADHSEYSLNNWGYMLLARGNYAKALEMFKLLVTLYPSSWNAYDSYGDALLQSNQKGEAIKMYQKSVELNPKNENGKKVLAELLKK